MNHELGMLAFIVFSCFCLRFVVEIITTILIADQKPAISAFIKLIAQALSALVIVIQTKVTQGSLLYIGATYSTVPVFVAFVASIYLYRSKYKDFTPRIKHVQLKYAKNLMNIGIKFFVIQIAVVVMFTTDSMIITQLFGPEQVTVYSIAYKYFSVISMTFALITSPLWSAYTEAWVKKDIVWIHNTIKKLKKIWFMYLILGICMVVFSHLLFRLWVGEKMVIPFKLILFMALYVIVGAYGAIYVNFINGTGKIQLQFYTAFFAAVLNIPLSVFFAKTLHLGPAGVILATLFCISYGPLIGPIQYKKIITGNAKGIWNK
ncbi:MAG: oligosaccharide flippase family protein [Bacteroidales bacterium]|nr:oligosaccharide flippase family protein [Bacteroidales bacterium]